MNDNDVIRVLIQALAAGYASLGLSDVLIKEAYQPQSQGVPDERTVFLSKITAARYGFAWFRDKYNPSANAFDTVDGVWRKPTYQLSGLATQNPTDTASLTASDIVEKGADILQSRAARQTLLAANIGIERIQNVRIAYFRDDRERHEAAPSFDFTLSYTNTIQSTTPQVTGASGQLIGV